MKKVLLFSLAFTASLISYAQTLDIDGVTILTDFYSAKMSHDGTQIVGEAEDGSTVYYNIPEDQFYYYEYCTFGRGYVVSNNGEIVGCELMDSESQTNVAVIMKDGEITTPEVFKAYHTSNIHSITPDGSRICGVVGNTGSGMSNLPFYSDLDANGNYSELKFLPVPKEDFFGNRPMYCSATWISEDGKTIAGQVVEARGFFLYPIVYRENEEGVWSYSLPSESLFNTENLPLPEPLGDFEQEYPDTPYPEPTAFMDPSQVNSWNAALLKWETNNFADEFSPYTHLEDFMTDEEIQAYLNAVEQYNANVEDYNEKNEKYWEQVYDIVDCSVFFVRNSMCLSSDGKWLASSAELEDTSSALYDGPVYYYVPYLFNLSTGNVEKIGANNSDLLTNQVFTNGDVMCATPAASVLPPRSWLYQRSKGKMVNIEDYVMDQDPFYGAWFEDNLSGYIPVAENENGQFEYEYATITGLVSASEDLTTMCGGVIGYAIELDMYLSYLFTGLQSGVESILADKAVDGIYRVFNLQGVKMLETKDVSSLQNLPKGIYIINGKKIKL